MGCSASKKQADGVAAPSAGQPASADAVQLTETAPLVLSLISAHNMPQHDLFSESDIFVVAKLAQPDGTTAEARWPVKWDSNHPIWESSRLLGAAGAESEVVLTFYDHDKVSSVDTVGTAQFRVGQLGSEPTKVPVKTVKSSTDAHCFVARATPCPATRKTIYMVRHGESVWNEAQADKDVVAMLSDVDHPLNEVGRAQAEKLSEQLGGTSAEAAAMRGAALVICSPLTRAVQTCLIALAPMLDKSPRAVCLNPALREKRNFGGKDSSGKWVGAELGEGVKSSMAALYSDDPGRGATLSAPPLDLHLVQNKWWLGSAESKEAVGERVEDMVEQVRHCPEETIVLVGHSHYFRELLGGFRHESCSLVGADGEAADAADLSSKKLSNAGVAKCEFDFEGSPATPVVSVALLFGTTLVS